MKIGVIVWLVRKKKIIILWLLKSREFELSQNFTDSKKLSQKKQKL